MKKKIMLRCVLGFPIGVTIGQIITIMLSLIWAKGYYAPCVPELAVAMGNEINAIILQTTLCGMLGMGFSASSIIWEIEHWGITKQTGIYFLIVSAIMMPIAYFTYWMEHSVAGFLSYFGIFALIFAIVWVIQFTIGRYNIRKMNENLQTYKKM
jgi:Protein of unknown function (DUF3021).